jgi:putative PIN family toxin of toxin-antitoxin system
VDIVLDTNVLLVSLSGKSKYYPIFEAFLDEKYILCVTNDILLEYEEIVGRMMGREIAAYLMQLLENAPNIRWLNKYYKWQLIQIDQDDNKFVDCAIACNAKFLVSDDNHFNVLDKISFPKVEVVKASEFKKILSL